MTEKTVLNATHRALGARMVDFGGWDMPINYGSQIEEHHAVRRAAGMFDVSHMTVIDLHGARTREFLRHLLANSVDKLKVHGKALYSCMLNEQGGVIDDLIAYYLGEEFFRLVVNAGTRAKDLAWIEKLAAAFDVQVKERPEFAMIAVQGPHARAKVLDLLHEVDRSRIEKLGKFSAAAAQGPHGMPLFVARTGYTGEDGFEIIVPNEHAIALWESLAAVGVAPAGLGARDTLRLEAGMALYGHEISEQINVFEAGLERYCKLEKGDFLGSAALREFHLHGRLTRRLTGLEMMDRGIARDGYKVFSLSGDEIGFVTSGSPAPFLKKNIALALLPPDLLTGAEVAVEVRGNRVTAKVVPTPFYRRPKKQP